MILKEKLKARPVRKKSFLAVEALEGRDLLSVSTLLPEVEMPPPVNTVTIADTGIDTSDPNIQDRLWTNPGESRDGIDNDGNGIVDDIHGADLRLNSGDNTDKHGHGTEVARSVDSTLDRFRAGNDIKLMMLKVTDDAGIVDRQAVIKAANYARLHGSRVLNLSLRLDNWSQEELGALIQAAGDMTVTVAAGNDGKQVSSQALPKNFVVVGATEGDEIAEWSRFGKGVAVAAEGADGTSTAAPKVAATLAMILKQQPHLSNTQAIDRVFQTVDQKPSLQGKVATGQLNVSHAVGEEVVASSTTQTAVRAEAPGAEEVATSDDLLKRRSWKRIVRNVSNVVKSGVSAVRNVVPLANFSVAKFSHLLRGNFMGFLPGLSDVGFVRTSSNYNHVFNGLEARHGRGNVWMASEEFTAFLGPETAAKYGLVGLVTGGAAIPLAARDVQVRLQQELQNLGRWLVAKHVSNATQMIRNVGLGRNVVTSQVEIKWLNVEYKYQARLLGGLIRPSVSGVSHLGLAVILK